MIGTVAALPPYAVGETVFVDELAARTLAEVGELQYVDARDAVSAAACNAILAAISRSNMQREANLTGLDRLIPRAALPPTELALKPLHFPVAVIKANPPPF